MNREIKTFIVVAIIATVIGILFGKTACAAAWLVGMVWCLVVAKEEWDKLVEQNQTKYEEFLKRMEGQYE